MTKKRIMLDYSRRIQVLLPWPLDFAELGFNDPDFGLNLDQIKGEFSTILNSYIRSCLTKELEIFPEFCGPSAIVADIESNVKIVAEVGLKNIPNMNILRSVYGSLRNRLIIYLLKTKANSLNFTIDDL
jgi:hypothetical protein